MTPMASRSRRSLPMLASLMAFHTTVVGWNMRKEEISTASSNALKNASCRRRPPAAASSSVELSTPNATLQMLSKAKRLRTSCRSTGSPESAASARKGSRRRCSWTRRTRPEKRRSERDEKE
uniref:Secreted protein n=1 Tax=Arundo donax TaxID=35708 RepID=A0A0A9H2R0_ARUDO